MGEDELLGGQLGDAVRRGWFKWPFLVADRLGPVDRRRGGEHEPPDAGALRRIDQPARGEDVARGVELEIGPTSHQAGHRGLMDDGIGAVQPPVDVVGPQVDLAETEAGRAGQPAQIGFLHRAWVVVDESVDTDDVVAASDESPPQAWNR